MGAFPALQERIGQFYAPNWGFTNEISLGSWAWTGLAAGVITYNTLTKDGQMLSEQADRWIEKHPLFTRMAVAVLAAHVANVAPRRLDLVHLFFTLSRRLR